MVVENIELNVKTNAGNAANDLRSLADALKSVAQSANAAKGASNAAANIKLPPIAEELQAAIRSASQVDLLKAKLESLNVALENAFKAGDLSKSYSLRSQILQTEKQLEKATSAANGTSKAVDETSKAIQRVGTAAKQATKHTNGFLGSLGRIAKYRILRTVIKEITSAFSEGLKNAYAYSQTINGTLSSAMDNLATKSFTMKNQLGASLGNLLQALIPIILKFVELLTKAAQVVSAFFSALGGGQYLVAKEVPQVWQDTTDATKAATKAAKEYQRTILGFDEINKLNAPSDSDTGTGTAGTTANAADMFDVKELPGWAQKIKDEWNKFINGVDFTPLKNAFERLKESAKNLAGVIGNALLWAWENVLVPLGKWTIEKLAPRLVDLLAAAFDLLSAAIKDFGEDFEPVWEKYLKPFFKALGEIVIVGLDELIDLLKDLTDVINGNTSWKEFISNITGMQWALIGLGSLAVITALTNVVGATALASTSFAELAGAIALAAFDIAYPISQITDAITGYSDAMEAHFNEQKNALTNYRDLYATKGKETADAWAKTVYDLDLTSMSFEESQTALISRVDAYWETIPQSLWEGFKDGWHHYFGKNGAGLGGLMGDAFTGAIDWIKNLLGIHSPSTVFSGIGGDIVQGLFNGFKDKWSGFTSYIQGLWSNLKSWWSNLTLGNIHIKMPHFSWTWQSVGGILSVPKISVDWYANGGFPDVGELFVARERGPELVGNLGGHTAVANNEDIEAGIEEAAYRGFMRAIADTGSNRDSGVIVMTVNGREFARGAYQDFKAVSREQGGTLITNFA